MSVTSCPIGSLIIVDDNDVDQLVYRRIVESSGLVQDVQSFYYAQDALDFLKTRDGKGIDAILLDINMPRMDGFQFLDEATALFGDDFSVVIVMLTSSMNHDDAARIRDYAVVRDYIGKPLTHEHLERIVNLLLSIHGEPRIQP